MSYDPQKNGLTRLKMALRLKPKPHKRIYLYVGTGRELRAKWTMCQRFGITSML